MGGYFFDFGFIYRNLPIFWSGLGVTLEVSVLAMAGAVVGGLVIAFGRMSRRVWLFAPATAYVEFLRNTPVLIQMFGLYFGLAVLGFRLSPITAGVLALAGQNAKTPRAVSDFSAMIRSRTSCASSNSSRACAPIVGSSKIAGYLPRNSQT